MAKFRGLRTKLCPNCGRIAAHKTLYVKTESGGRSKWFRLFWACTACNALNHVVLPTYKLESVPSELPSPFVTSIVNAMKDGPLNFDELIQSLRRHCEGVRHVFNPDVALAFEYLKRHGIVTEEIDDLTERILAELRARSSESRHLGPCPAEMNQGVVRKSLVSVYSQGWVDFEGGDKGTPARRKRFAPVGALCLQCGYHNIDPRLIAKP